MIIMIGWVGRIPLVSSHVKKHKIHHDAAQTQKNTSKGTQPPMNNTNKSRHAAAPTTMDQHTRTHAPRSITDFHIRLNSSRSATRSALPPSPAGCGGGLLWPPRCACCCVCVCACVWAHVSDGGEWWDGRLVGKRAARESIDTLYLHTSTSTSMDPTQHQGLSTTLA